MQTFTAVTPPTTTPSGGGMVVQYPTKVIDKKELKRKKEQKELMISIDVKLDALIKKNPKIDFTKVNDEIKKRNKEIENLIKNKDDALNNEIQQIKEDNRKGKKEFAQEVADFTDKIFQLNENTKLLPNSLNSLLISAERATMSKFKELQEELKTNFDKANTFTSKFNGDVKTSSEIMNKRFNEIENRLTAEISKIPKNMSNQNDRMDEEIEKLNVLTEFGKVIDENMTSLLKNIKVSYGSFIECRIKDIDYRHSMINLMGFQLANSTSQTDKSEMLKKNAEYLDSEMNDVKMKIQDVKDSNLKEFDKVEKSMSKIPNKRDLNYTQEVISEKIKDSQSNNTKKVKELREHMNDVKKKVELAAEENNLNAQLSVLNEDKDAQ